MNYMDSFTFAKVPGYPKNRMSKNYTNFHFYLFKKIIMV